MSVEVEDDESPNQAPEGNNLNAAAKDCFPADRASLPNATGSLPNARDSLTDNGLREILADTKNLTVASGNIPVTKESSSRKRKPGRTCRSVGDRVDDIENKTEVKEPMEDMNKATKSASKPSKTNPKKRAKSLETKENQDSSAKMVKVTETPKSKKSPGGSSRYFF